MNDIKILLDHSFIGHLCLGQDHAGRSSDLIIKEFFEVLVIDPASFRIHNSTVAVQFQSFDRLYDLQDIRELADTGWFDHDPVWMIFRYDLLQRCLEVSLQCAADASAVDFIDHNACFF